MAHKIPKNQKSEKKNYIFEMSPLKHSANSVFYKYNVEVNFQPKIIQAQDQTNSVHQSFNMQNQDIKRYSEDKQNINGKLKEYSIIPTFNEDYKYYTSCFVVPFESEDNDDQILQNHNIKMRQNMQQIPVQDILVPKPRSKSLYCAVCKINYEDYLQHIDSNNHKKSIKKSQFNTEIQKLFSIVKKDIQPQGIITRSKRRHQLCSIYYELDLKNNKKRKIEKIVSQRQTSKADEVMIQNAYTCMKRQPLETTAKSSLNLLD